MSKKLEATELRFKFICEYPDVLTVGDASEILGVSIKTVYNIIKRGELQTRSVGRLIRIPKSFIISYLGIETDR